MGVKRYFLASMMEDIFLAASETKKREKIRGTNESKSLNLSKF